MSLAKMLIKSPQKLKSFFNTIPIPIYAWQIRRNNLFLIDYNNAAYEEMKGEIKNNLGSIASEFYKENIDLLDVLKECADKSTSLSKEIKYFCSISNQLKLLLIKTDFIPPDLVLVQNISKTKQNLLEQKVKESKRNYRMISENANDILILTNEKYEIEYINNQALKKLLGYSEKEVIGCFGLDFIHPNDVEKTIHSLKKGIEEGQGLVEVRARHKKGHYIWIEATGKSFNNDMGVLKGIIILRDITKRKSFETNLIESEEKYRVAYDQADFYKNLFTHNISNVLSVINGSSQLCSYFLEDPEKAKEVKDNLNRIRDQVIRAKILIKNIQRMSEINSNKPLLKSINIYKSLTKSIKYINESYEEKNIEISVDSSNKQFFVYANDLILDVFENLLINAIKYNENSIKKITVRLAKEEKDGVQFLKMEFIDNGIGIINERKEIIFQKGHKKDEYNKGMGIGLTLVKIIIDDYNGFICVEDKVPKEYSKGSNFIILIPLASSEN